MFKLHPFLGLQLSPHFHLYILAIEPSRKFSLSNNQKFIHCVLYKTTPCQAVVAHIFNLSTQEAENPAWKKNKKNKTKNTIPHQCDLSIRQIPKYILQLKGYIHDLTRAVLNFPKVQNRKKNLILTNFLKCLNMGAIKQERLVTQKSFILVEIIPRKYLILILWIKY